MGSMENMAHIGKSHLGGGQSKDERAVFQYVRRKGGRQTPTVGGMNECFIAAESIADYFDKFEECFIVPLRHFSKNTRVT